MARELWLWMEQIAHGTAEGTGSTSARSRRRHRRSERLRCGARHDRGGGTRRFPSSRVQAALDLLSPMPRSIDAPDTRCNDWARGSS